MISEKRAELYSGKLVRADTSPWILVHWRPGLERASSLLCLFNASRERPRERREAGEHDLFRSRLDQIIDMNHPLAKLVRMVDWGFSGRARFRRDLHGQSRPSNAAVRGGAVRALDREPIAGTSAARSYSSTYAHAFR